MLLFILTNNDPDAIVCRAASGVQATSFGGDEKPLLAGIVSLKEHHLKNVFIKKTANK